MSPNFEPELLWPWLVGLLPWMAAFALLLIVNLVTGLLLAAKLKLLEWEKVPEFLLNAVLFFWAWITCEMLAFLPLVLGIEIPTYAAALVDVGPKVIYGLIVVGKYVGSIVKNIKLILTLKDPEPWVPELQE